MILRDEVLRDPAGLGYTGHTASEVANILNEVDRPAFGRLSPLKLNAWAARAGRWAKIKRASTGAVPHMSDATWSRAIAFDNLMAQGMDVKDVGTATTIAALVNNGILSAEDSTRLYDAAHINVSRAYEIGADFVYASDIWALGVFGHFGAA